MKYSILVMLLGCSAASTPSGLEASVACEDAPGDGAKYCVRNVEGRVTTFANTPLRGAIVTVCGPVCFGSTSNQDGAFSVPVGARLSNDTYRLFVHARPLHASLIVPLPSSPMESVTLSPLEVPAFEVEKVPLPSDNLPSSSTVQLGPITLGIAAGTAFELAFEDAEDVSEGRFFRYAKVAPERAPAFAKGAALVYALGPFDAKSSKPMTLALRDVGGLAPNSPVEFIAMRGVEFAQPNRGGEGERIATGHVNADATEITTDMGSGLSSLTWLAIRPVQ